MRFKRSNKFSLLILLLTLLMTLDTSRASACSCAAGLPLIDQITNASAIFSGKVTQFSFEDGPPLSLGPGIPAVETRVQRAHVEVSQVWKEWAGQPFSVNAAVDSGPCAYTFQVDTEYLIYAQEYSDHLFVTFCSNTKPLEMAGSEIAALNNLYRPIPLNRLSPDATVTVTGHGVSYATADQLEVHMFIDEEWQDNTPIEEAQKQVVDWLKTHGAGEMLASGRYSLLQDGFYLTVRQNELSTGDLGTALALLSNIESARQQEGEAGIEHMEVKFSLQDCSQAAVDARSSALFKARNRAELLAIQAGGKRGALVAIVEASVTPSPEGAGGLCYDTQTQWLSLPLESDSNTAQQIIWRASLSVTYEVDEARTSESPVPLATPSSAQTSPLPTPTAP